MTPHALLRAFYSSFFLNILHGIYPKKQAQWQVTAILFKSPFSRHKQQMSQEYRVHQYKCHYKFIEQCKYLKQQLLLRTFTNLEPDKQLDGSISMSRNYLYSKIMQSNGNSIVLSNRKFVMYQRNESKTEQQWSEMQCTKTSSKNETLEFKDRERRKHQEQTNKQTKSHAWTAICTALSFFHHRNIFTRNSVSSPAEYAHSTIR